MDCSFAIKPEKGGVRGSQFQQRFFLPWKWEDNLAQANATWCMLFPLHPSVID